MPIAAAQSGETLSPEFEELFREHYQLLYRTAYGITGNRHDAEDVLQSIFVKLLQNGLSPEVMQSPARYLHRAAVNLSLNVLRARKRRMRVDGVAYLDMTPELKLGPTGNGTSVDERERVQASDEQHARLMDGITRLKPRAVEILMLHYKHGYSDAQIARLLGTSRGTIAVTLFRIRARLKRLLRAGSDGEQV